MRYLIGIIFIAIGVSLIIFTEWIVRNFGKIAWAEAKLGSEGGTRIFIKLIGIVTILFAFMLISGRIFSILEFIFVPGA